MDTSIEQEDPNAVMTDEHYQLFPLPPPDNIVARPLTLEEEARIDTLSRLQFFLATAPTRWTDVTQTSSRITKFQLPNGECISCILWNGLYHITGTDIAFRFEAFGRPIHATKKWEEGVFSDLRNLKPGQDACLEEPKSPLLDFLFRNGCIRTQKKQKVFYWFSVPHDRLFLDALERDLKREKVNQEPTSIVVGEPARSFKYDPRRSLYDQFAGQNPGLSGNYFGSREYGASPIPGQDPYFGGPPPISMSHQPPPPNIALGLLPPAHSFPPAGFPQPYPPPMPVPPHTLPQMHPMGPPPPHIRHASPATIALGLPHQNRLTPGGFRAPAPLEGSPHYKRRRSRLSRSPAVHMGPRDENDGPAGADDSFASDESSGPQPKKACSVSRAASVAASAASGRSASVDSAGEIRNYVCPYKICRRPFRRLEHLKRHVRTHTQEKPYWCNRCPKKFARQDNLTNHLRVHDKHDGEDGEYEVDMDMSEYEEEEGMNMGLVPREWSASPAHSMSSSGSRNASGSSMGGHSLSYTRHSTLPPQFAPERPNYTVYNPGLPPAAGVSGSTPLDYVPYVPGGTGPNMSSSQSSLYPNSLGVAPGQMDNRRHRSATPYAPVHSSNLAYSQPVTAYQPDFVAGSAPIPSYPSQGNDGSMRSMTPSQPGYQSMPTRSISNPTPVQSINYVPAPMSANSSNMSSAGPGGLHILPSPANSAYQLPGNGNGIGNGLDAHSNGNGYPTVMTPVTAPMTDLNMGVQPIDIGMDAAGGKGGGGGGGENGMLGLAPSPTSALDPKGPVPITISLDIAA